MFGGCQFPPCSLCTRCITESLHGTALLRACNAVRFCHTYRISHRKTINIRFCCFLYSQLCFCIFCISLTVVNKWYQTLLALFSIAHPCAGWMRVAKNNTILFLFNYLFLSNYCRNILFQIYVCVTVNQHWTNVLCPDFTSYLYSV